MNVNGRTEKIALGVLVIGSVVLAYHMTKPLMLVVAAAAAAASLLANLFATFVTKLRGRKRLAALTSVAVILLALLGPVGTLLGFGGHRLASELLSLTSALRSDDNTALESFLARTGPLRPLVETGLDTIGAKAGGWLPTIAAAATRSLGVVGHAAATVLIGLFLFSVALYYFLLNGGDWAARAVRIVPLPDRDVRLFFHRFRQTALGILVGNFGTAATQATVATVGYLVCRAPAPLLFGAVTFVAALIPLVGPALIWLPLAGWLWVSGHTVAAIGLAIYGVAVISTIDNFVRPLLTKRGVPIHSLLLFLALFGGVATYGLTGIFWGPFVMVLAVTSVELWEDKVSQSDGASGTQSDHRIDAGGAPRRQP
ncbi:MAG: hypothetical protein JWN44_1853 [Myxococcales bacterium]|nr:hypothetical protein [Myxococcales bacterium]